MLFARSECGVFGYALPIQSFVELGAALISDFPTCWSYLNIYHITGEFRTSRTNFLKAKTVGIAQLILKACIGANNGKLQLCGASLCDPLLRYCKAHNESKKLNEQQQKVVTAILATLTRKSSKVVPTKQIRAATIVAQDMLSLVEDKNFEEWKIKLEKSERTGEGIYTSWKQKLKDAFGVDDITDVVVSDFDMFFLGCFVKTQSNPSEMAAVFYGLFRSKEYPTNCWNSFIPALRDPYAALWLSVNCAAGSYSYLKDTFNLVGGKVETKWGEINQKCYFFPHSELPLQFSSAWTKEVDKRKPVLCHHPLLCEISDKYLSTKIPANLAEEAEEHQNNKKLLQNLRKENRKTTPDKRLRHKNKIAELTKKKIPPHLDGDYLTKSISHLLSPFTFDTHG